MASNEERLLPSNNIQQKFTPQLQAIAPQQSTTVISLTSIDNAPPRFIICTSMFYAICLMLASGFFFGFTAAIIQWGSNIGYGSMEMLMWRSGTQIIIAILSSIITEQSQTEWKLLISLTKSDIIYLILRGIFGGLSVACYFHSITLISVGDAVTVLSIYPIIAAFCAYLMLNEKITIVHFLALTLAIIGCALISQPSFIFPNDSKKNSGSTYWIGFTVAFVGGCIGGVAFPLIVKAKRSGTTALICSQGLGCFITGLIMGFAIQSFHTLTTGKGWLLFFGLSIVGFLNQWTFNAGARLIPAGLSSLLRATDTFWGYILQIIWFGQIPNFITILGAILVISGVAAVSYEKIKKDTKKAITNSNLGNTSSGNAELSVHYTPVIAAVVPENSGLIPPLMNYQNLNQK